MKEKEYIILSNKIHVESAFDSIRKILAGKEYLVSKKERSDLLDILSGIKDRFYEIELIDDEDSDLNTINIDSP
jgi:hypothetical protein